MVRLTVHVERVLVHDDAGVTREALEAAIGDALREGLGAGPLRPPVREPGIGEQVAATVAPAVLSRAGLGPAPSKGRPS